MKKCAFCKDYDFITSLSKEQGLQRKAFVCLRTVTRHKGEKGWLGHSSITYGQKKLRFCPSCGKRLTSKKSGEIKPRLEGTSANCIVYDEMEKRHE